MTSSHRRSAASERRSSPSRSTAQIATSTRPRLSAAWGGPRGSAFSCFAWRCGWVSALASPAKASLAPTWAATSSSPARRWASEIPARALGDLKRSSRVVQWGPPITVVYIGLSSGPRRPGGQPCQKGTLSSIAITPPAVASRRRARTGGRRKMSGRLFGYARVSVASDAASNNLQGPCA